MPSSVFHGALSVGLGDGSAVASAACLPNALGVDVGDEYPLARRGRDIPVLIQHITCRSWDFDTLRQRGRQKFLESLSAEFSIRNWLEITDLLGHRS